ncbi:MAG: cell division protein FtsL [Burkholderiaceae bacterium]
MTRINLVLLLAVIASALYLVRTQYESRRLFTELDRAQGESRRLDVESERLQVEKRAQATPLRVEKLAKEQLQMRTATPAITQYVTYKASAPSGAHQAPQAPEAAK